MSKKNSGRRKLIRKSQKTSLFAPLLNRAEKEIVKHLSQHDRVVYLRAMRLGISVAEYKLNYCQ